MNDVTGTREDVRAALRQGMAGLLAANVPSAVLAAELLLMHVLRRDRAWIFSHPEEPLSAEDITRYAALLARRAAGVPTQYLTGEQEFWGLKLEVTPDVLIPRPETEHVVEVALARLGTRREAELRVADAGTGSGCLAIALAKECSRAEIFATDISAAALEVARRNAAQHGVAERVHLLLGNMLEPFFLDMTAGARPEFDLIVSNPPYIARREAESLPREVREHEPELALFGGESGTEFYGPLFQQARALLKRGGIVAVEIGHGALDAVRGLLETDGAWRNVAAQDDLAGIPRVVSAERTSSH
jgi:release factor glutamine methyltransferase